MGPRDLVVIAEKGQVVCRDFLHSRHLCQKFPLATTPHERYCELCYCYVCDSAAPVRSGPIKAIVMPQSTTKGGSQRGRRNRGKRGKDKWYWG
ncbi:RPM1 interacting protein 13-like [Syzygium oleosum]|uniref:RPM1 interacting protein 13-like n=1 Tax=Syzygium oleosum TaxID=219896 RepID=UPI0024B8F4DA|nr:RPM1 interacting protein 13-like [Syzygium oleosum]